MLRRRWWMTLALMALTLALPAMAREKLWSIEGYWLPEGTSSFSREIDNLFYAILYLTGFVFLGTELALLYFVFKYRSSQNKKSYYTHGNHKLEMIWTVTPAIILAVIALVQKSSWDKIKNPGEEALKGAVQVQLFAEQFSWSFRYPGKDAKFGTEDDFLTDRLLKVPVNKKVVVEQTSKDVIHSLFLPYQRLKQDVVPGMMIKAWFDTTKTTAEMRKDRPTPKIKDMRGQQVEWDYPIVCAELCGNQHFQMNGRCEVVTEQEWNDWNNKMSEKFAKDVKEGEFDWSDTPIGKFWKLDKEGQRVWPKAKAAVSSAH